MIPAETQGDEFTTARILWYSDTDVKMFIDTRFDGNGNVIVRFVIRNEGKETSYNKYDSAEWMNHSLSEVPGHQENGRLYVSNRDGVAGPSG